MDEVTPAAKKQSVVNESSQRSYLAMMLLAFFAGPLGLARIYRGDASMGWARFWIFIGTYLIYMISFAFLPLFALTGLILFSLSVWGIVDFFLLYGVRDDAAHKLLHRNELDANVTKILFIVYIVGLGLGLIAAILGLIFWSALAGSIRLDGMMHTTPFIQTY